MASRAKRGRNAVISSKIRRVKQDSPGLTQRQVLGKSFGILRHEGKIGSRRKGGRKR